MKELKEQLVGFETAKTLANSIRFETDFMYDNYGKLGVINMAYSPSGTFHWLKREDSPFKHTAVISLNTEATRYINNEVFVLKLTPAPTQGLVQKWLRETHNIDIEIQINTKGLTAEKIGYSCVVINNGCAVHKSNLHKTYEDALEFALQKTLELI